MTRSARRAAAAAIASTIAAELRVRSPLRGLIWARATRMKRAARGHASAHVAKYNLLSSRIPEAIDGHMRPESSAHVRAFRRNRGPGALRGTVYDDKASLQNCTHFAISVMRSDPGGIGYSNSI